MEHSLFSTTSDKNSLAQNESCADSDHTTKENQQEDEVAEAGRGGDGDRGGLVGTGFESNGTAVQPDNIGGRTDSEADDQVLYRPSLDLNGGSQNIESGVPEVTEILAEKESGVLESKDTVDHHHVGDDHDLHKSTEDGATETNEDLPDLGNVLKPSQDSGLENATETDTSCDLIASKLDAVNVSVQEVDDKDEESKAF